jgi:hypothetical protein
MYRIIRITNQETRTEETRKEAMKTLETMPRDEYICVYDEADQSPYYGTPASVHKAMQETPIE